MISHDRIKISRHRDTTHALIGSTQEFNDVAMPMKQNLLELNGHVIHGRADGAAKFTLRAKRPTRCIGVEGKMLL